MKTPSLEGGEEVAGVESLALNEFEVELLERSTRTAG